MGGRLREVGETEITSNESTSDPPQQGNNNGKSLVGIFHGNHPKENVLISIYIIIQETIASGKMDFVLYADWRNELWVIHLEPLFVLQRSGSRMAPWWGL